ncbi:MAG: beta-galactosidase, partial [Alistipes sp.]|nr:beta-galactosidase [Alistipes sp.]
MLKIYSAKIIIVSTLLFCCVSAAGRAESPRREQKLEKEWRFTKGDPAGAMEAGYDDSAWEVVRVPHDWAVYGPFDSIHDAQKVAIVQNLEQVATLKTGRTGGLPYIGVGWYRRELPEFAPGETVTLLFDGAMSEARVYVNGQEAYFWPYGYNSFHCDITPHLDSSGGDNILAVRLENLPESSRWYPGAGLYRNVHLITTRKTHIPVWGTYVTTPEAGPDRATVRLETTVQDGTGNTSVSTVITDQGGRQVAMSDGYEMQGGKFIQTFSISEPDLWSPENPALYVAHTRVFEDGELSDYYTTRFGIRSLEFIPDRGFFLNGEPRKIQGVCNHHDLGPLGAAVNTAALRRQLAILKDMGCDAIRTAHNMPAPELVALCDEMGFMVMVEPFDEWDIAKCRNGYHRYFHEWAERDMVNMIHNYRNNPSVIMWSIGNEVPSQCAAEGYRTAAFLRDICHREDPTRPVTCGMDQVKCVIGNGFAEQTDIPGFNYRVHLYEEAYETLPQKIVLGAETSSTFSSRGIYKFPVTPGKNVTHPDQQCSSYDLECASWSNLPDEDFAMVDDHDWNIGQFVWTGFDYLGEPTPYDGTWPNHSSMFGIIDLASIPKDRYWLYRSQWNRTDHTLHILPHWNWEGREGETTPVFVYT